MYYYGNSYGYGSPNCCGNTGGCGGYPYYGYGYGSNYAIILVLFILLVIIIGSKQPR